MLMIDIDAIIFIVGKGYSHKKFQDDKNESYNKTSTGKGLEQDAFCQTL